MRPAEAAVILQQMSKLTTELTALTPEEWQGTGLKAHRVLKNEKSGRPIFYYVKRLELMELIRTSANIHPKGVNICHILNFRTNQEGTR